MFKNDPFRTRIIIVLGILEKYIKAYIKWRPVVHSVTLDRIGCLEVLIKKVILFWDF